MVVLQKLEDQEQVSQKDESIPDNQKNPEEEKKDKKKDSQSENKHSEKKVCL